MSSYSLLPHQLSGNPWWLSDGLANKEINHRFSFFGRGWISIHGGHYKWAYLVEDILGITWSVSVYTYASLLWQSGSQPYSWKPRFPWADKHIEIDCHFIREKLESGDPAVTYLTSQKQPADIFTKVLGKKQFVFLRGKLGMIDPHTPHWGGVLGL